MTPNQAWHSSPHSRFQHTQYWRSRTRIEHRQALADAQLKANVSKLDALPKKANTTERGSERKESGKESKKADDARSTACNAREEEEEDAERRRTLRLELVGEERERNVLARTAHQIHIERCSFCSEVQTHRGLSASATASRACRSGLRV